MKRTARLQNINRNKSGGPCVPLYIITMLRTFLLLLVVGLVARASDPINAPLGGQSVTVAQPHVTAELIPEMSTIEPGKPFDIALHLHCDPQWHTYWINPGDAGLATSINWTLPPGFTAGPIQWPTPEKHPMGPLMTYGYASDVYLLTTITPPKGELPQHFDIKAHASWLACLEECIPGKADLTLPLDSGLMNLRLPINNTDFFAQARERLPVPNTRWDVSATYVPNLIQSGPTKKEGIAIHFSPREKLGYAVPNARFFPEQANVLENTDADNLPPLFSDESFSLGIALQQSGDKPDKLSGVLVIDEPVIIRAVYIAEFPVSKVAGAGPAPGGTTVAPDNLLSGSPQATGGHPQTSVTSENVGDGHRPTLQEGTAAQPAPATLPTMATLLAVLGAAFIGGLILNLMPCVLPVLSLKVFSLMKHAGENPKTAWIQGVAFTAGVVLSFWVLAGLLLALRSAGNHLGWGFQMQSPGFVLALIFLFFLLALNLFGVFELGSSLVGLDAKATGHLGGLASSFGNGALATVAATPCTAPFMGSALGFAAQQPAYIALLVFTFLAFGMATPYLLLTIFPGALRFVPKPGAWMEAFKQFMGFLLMATVVFLVYVFGALVGEGQIPGLLFTLLIWSLVAWFYGRWGPRHRWVRFVTYAFLILYLIAMWDLISVSVLESAGTYTVHKQKDGPWQPWTQDAVNAALDKGQPVFVDFTAAWCLSCKVNEQVALGTDAVKKAFADKNVALFRADWTHADPAISKALQQFNRDGVPLYLVYSPKNKDAPQVLPEVITPGIVLDALNRL